MFISELKLMGKFRFFFLDEVPLPRLQEREKEGEAKSTTKLSEPWLSLHHK